jgi:hypothetical protein
VFSTIVVVPRCLSDFIGSIALSDTSLIEENITESIKRDSKHSVVMDHSVKSIHLA